MERIEHIDIKAETKALEEHHRLTLYTFDRYDRLEHYATIDAATPQEREAGDKTYFLTVNKGGDDMTRFEEPDDNEDHDSLEAAIERIRTIWHGRAIWYDRDGEVPGVTYGITFADLLGAAMIDETRDEIKKNAFDLTFHAFDADPQDEPDGPQSVKDAETIEQAGLRIYTPTLYELLDDYITDTYDRLLSDGDYSQTELTAWWREAWRNAYRSLES